LLIKATTTQPQSDYSVANITGIPADVKQGFTQNFYATALYASGATTDITSEVTWSSSNPSIAEFTHTSGGFINGHDGGDGNDYCIVRRYYQQFRKHKGSCFKYVTVEDYCYNGRMINDLQSHRAFSATYDNKG